VGLVKRPLRYRLSRLDWDVINEALAHYEAEAADGVPHTERQIGTTRLKVHERLERSSERKA